MLRIDRSGDVAVEIGSTVLMARIVDRDGVSVRPTDARAIEYSLCELDPWWPNYRNLVGGFGRLSLEVDEVLFDELQLDSEWTVDAVGYNFRHEIDFRCGKPFPKAGFHYEVCYKITLASGEATNVRFQLRC